MPKFQFVLLIHAHQPVGNFDSVFERSYVNSYQPFLEVLSRHPAIHVGMHYSGSLLEWIERAHPEYFERLRELVRRGQVEMVGGGFYEPVLIAIPPVDRFEQIARLSNYIQSHFGKRPRGAWLAERVWEPQIPSTLAPAGVEYTLVDDNHFLGAGFDPGQLHGYYLAEDLGRAVKVLPGLKLLRYLIPFRDVNETVQFLRGAAEAHSGGFAAMGDDLEKFGVWPGTHDHCYRDGWLERFFSALEQCGDWLEVSAPANAVASREPMGRAGLPSTSYAEMMEWSLPTSARKLYHGLVEEFSSRPEALPFLRGGTWRGFFSKYPESNLLHQKMLHVSEKVRHLDVARRGKGYLNARELARTLLLRGQCNDAYWHGIFGGLYAPHLRTALWRALVQSESIADGLAHRDKGYAQAARMDFDCDGRDEIYFTSGNYAALVAPADGGTVSMLDFRPSDATLINSLKRQPEAYHDALRQSSANGSPAVHSIHEQKRSKEEGLESSLNYDRWPRNAFRLFLFSRSKSLQDYQTVRLDEDAGLAGGRYQVSRLSATRVTLVSEEGGSDWAAEKILSFQSARDGFDAACDVRLRRSAQGPALVNVGMEVVVNFLAPSAPDRYFQSDGKRFPLCWSAAVPATDLLLVDEWQRISVTLEAHGANSFWIAPIETVSESEDGYERIYQGSQVIAVWPIDLAAGAEWEGLLSLRVARLP